MVDDQLRYLSINGIFLTFSTSLLIFPHESKWSTGYGRRGRIPCLSLTLKENIKLLYDRCRSFITFILCQRDALLSSLWTCWLLSLQLIKQTSLLPSKVKRPLWLCTLGLLPQVTWFHGKLKSSWPWWEILRQRWSKIGNYSLPRWEMYRLKGILRTSANCHLMSR